MGTMKSEALNGGPATNLDTDWETDRDTNGARRTSSNGSDDARPWRNIRNFVAGTLSQDLGRTFEAMISLGRVEVSHALLDLRSVLQPVQGMFLAVVVAAAFLWSGLILITAGVVLALSQITTTMNAAIACAVLGVCFVLAFAVLIYRCRCMMSETTSKAKSLMASFHKGGV